MNLLRDEDTKAIVKKIMANMPYIICHEGDFIKSIETAIKITQESLVESAHQNFDEYWDKITDKGRLQVSRRDLHEQTWCHAKASRTLQDYRIFRISSVISQMNGWANFENYVNNHMINNISELNRTEGNLKWLLENAEVAGIIMDDFNECLDANDFCEELKKEMDNLNEA